MSIYGTEVNLHRTRGYSRGLLGARLLIMRIIVYTIGNHWPEGQLTFEQWNSDPCKAEITHYFYIFDFS